jgi:hypothetical protein
LKRSGIPGKSLTRGVVPAKSFFFGRHKVPVNTPLAHGSWKHEFFSGPFWGTHARGFDRLHFFLAPTRARSRPHTVVDALPDVLRRRLQVGFTTKLSTLYLDICAAKTVDAGFSSGEMGY